MSAIVALDLGDKRVGVALLRRQAGLALPLTTLPAGEGLLAALRRICQEEAVDTVVVGLPRGLNGQETAQTEHIRGQGTELGKALGLPLYWCDEAVTSSQAEAELAARRRPYIREDIDALAAAYILEDFIAQHPEMMHA